MYQEQFRFTISYTPVAGDLPQVMFTNNSRAAWSLVEAFYTLGYDTLAINSEKIVSKIEAYELIKAVCLESKRTNTVAKELV